MTNCVAPGLVCTYDRGMAKRLKKGQRIENWSQMRRGDAYTYNGSAYVVDWDPTPLVVSQYDDFRFLGASKPIAIPGLSSTYPAHLVGKKTLVVGCQTIDALGAFKALGEALGYEVTG